MRYFKAIFFTDFKIFTQRGKLARIRTEKTDGAILKNNKLLA